MKRHVKKEPVVTTLTESEKLLLIETVEQFPAIWDEEETGHKQTFARKDAWRNVINIMELEMGRTYNRAVLQSTLKICAILSCEKEGLPHGSFGHNRSCCRDSGEVASWPFYKPLKFLSKTTDPGVRYSNVLDDTTNADIASEAPERASVCADRINTLDAVNSRFMGEALDFPG
ncbi:unnamed protein product [Heligmosomoides polygyrus]|uniref:MADF domain-containing protein n=1 Tax=Heligmosomoides polygyrus TaxID=6339 RepID=A0A183FT31_HELPZ|nr:unnamed protein product [Heligmosomoides polygyrus]